MDAVRHCAQCGERQSPEARFCPRCGATLVAAAPAEAIDPLVGTVVADRYRLIERIGQGASGSIYRAEHTTLMRQLAVKILHPQHSQDEAAVERFRREATTIGQIDNDHLLQISDFGQTADHRLFFAMELLEGETLDHVLEREGRISPERAVKILLQVADALTVAHGLGYIHRDLRPRNVFLAVRRGERDFVKLLDFALAKLARPDADMRQTQLGMTFGDPRYMSPEQASGKALDARSDVYSLGVVAFQSLTGQVPFDGTGPIDVLQKVLDAPTPDIGRLRPDAPPWLQRVVERALEKRPEDRFDGMPALAECLSSESLPPAGPRTAIAPAVAPLSATPVAAPTKPVPSRTLIMETALPESVAAAAAIREAPVVTPLPAAPIEKVIVAEEARNDVTPRGFARPPAAQATSATTAETASGEVRSRTTRRANEAESSPSVVVETDYIPLREELTGPQRVAGDDGWFSERAAPVDEVFDDELPKKTKGVWLIGGIAGGLSLAAIGTIALWPHPPAESPKTAPTPVAVAAPAAPTPISTPTPAPTPTPISTPTPAPTPRALPAPAPPAPLRARPKPVAVAKPAPAEPATPKGFADPFAPGTGSTNAELDALVKSGRQKLAAGELAQAQTAFSKARTLDGRNADAFAGLGEVAFEQGDYVSATNQLKQAVKLSPNRARFLVLLGQSYYKSGRAKEAAQEYRRALRIDPTNQEARRSLELAEKKLAQGG